MKPSSLPAGYADEIKLNEKLSDTELQSAVAEIEELRADAAKYQAKWDTDLASMLTKKSYVAYEALKTRYPVYTELKAQWNQFNKDLKKIDELEAELTKHNEGTESIKQQLQNREIYAAEQEAKINDLKQKLNPESPQATYRTAMVDYAKFHDKEHAEKIVKRAHRLEELRKAGKIQEDVEGVSIPEIGLKTASKAVQEKALQDVFGDKLQSNRSRDDHQNKKSWTKKVEKRDIDAYGSTFGERELCSNEQLKVLRAWIRANFADVKTSNDELYLVQMINPDLFEGMWMKDKKWSGRQYLELRRIVNYRFVDAVSDPYSRCGLFLVQKRM